MRAAQKPVVRAAALKAAITQLRDLSKANANRSSREARECHRNCVGMSEGDRYVYYYAGSH